MKTIVAALVAATALTALGGAAIAAPHRHHVKVCRTVHHHRSCTWVWR